MNLTRAVILSILLIVAAPFFGAYLNNVVMEANGNKMPVAVNIDTDSTPKLTFNLDSRHCLLTSETKYPLLADIVYINGAIYSFGDFFILSADYDFWIILPLTIIAIWSRVRKR